MSEQAARRRKRRRKRQTRDVLVVNLVAEGTIEHKMLSTLKFKQGLADLVLDARGDAADFESEKSKNAFLARVSSLMESQLPAVVRASGTEKTESAKAEATEPNAADTQKSAPAEDPLTPETLAMLAKLAKLGLVTLSEEAKRRIAAVGKTATPQMSEAERRAKAAGKRHAVALSAMEKAKRSAHMGDVLAAGGFGDEATSPYCAAVTLAAGAALFASGGKADETEDAVPDAVQPVAFDDFFAVTGQLALSQDAVLTLQFAVQSRPIPDASNRVNSFLDECVAQVG